MYRRTAHLYKLECSTVQCSPAVEEEEKPSHPCVECEIPRELLLYTDKLISPLEIGFERFEDNELDNATIPEEQKQQRNLYYECLDNIFLIIYFLDTKYYRDYLLSIRIFLNFPIPYCSYA